MLWSWRPRVFFKTDVLKNFTKISEKQLRRRMLQQLTQTFNGIWSSKKSLVKITEAATGGVL